MKKTTNVYVGIQKDYKAHLAARALDDKDLETARKLANRTQYKNEWHLILYSNCEYVYVIREGSEELRILFYNSHEVSKRRAQVVKVKHHADSISHRRFTRKVQEYANRYYIKFDGIHIELPRFQEAAKIAEGEMKALRDRVTARLEEEQYV